MSDVTRYRAPPFSLQNGGAAASADFGWSAGPMPPPQPNGPSLTIKDIARALWRRKLRLLLLFIVLMAPVTAVIMSLPASYTAQAMLVLRTRAPVTQELQSDSMQVQPSVENTMNLIRSEVQILNSETLAERVVQHLDLDQPGPSAPPSLLHRGMTAIRQWLGTPAPAVAQSPELRMEQLVKDYRSHLTAFNDGKSFIILVSYSAKDPALAERVLRDHLQFYLADQVKEKEIALDSVQNWLDAELVRLASKVQGSEQRLLEFRGNHNLLRSGGETLASHEMNGLVDKLGQARNDLFQKQARLQDIRNAGSGSADTAVLQSPLIQKQRQDEEALSSKLAELNNKYSPDHPAVRAAVAALVATRQSLASEISRMSQAAEHDVSAASATVSVLEQQVANLSKNASASEMSDLSQAQLQRETDADRQLYDDLLRRSKQIEIQRQVQQEPDARVASGPSVSYAPSSPHRTLLFAGASGAMALLSAGFALFLDRGRFQSRSLLAIEAICRLPGLSSVPSSRLLGRRRSFLRLPDPRSVFALSLQTLRNSLSIYSSGIQPQVVAFTSALPGEGKTTLAAYFAQSLAMPGFKVLVIDGDLRHSRLQQTLKLSSKPGLQELIEDENLSLAQCVRPVERGLFDVLMAAQPVANPQSLLNSPGFTRLLDKARGAYDFIVIDTPPVAAVDDALPIAKLADATVLVIRWCRTPHDVVRAAARRLDLAGGRVTGAVLNAVDMSEYQASSHDLEAYRPLRSAYIQHER